MLLLLVTEEGARCELSIVAECCHDEATVEAKGSLVLLLLVLVGKPEGVEEGFVPFAIEEQEAVVLLRRRSSCSVDVGPAGDTREGSIK